MKNIQTWIIVGLLVLLTISILTRPTKEITDLEPYRIQAAIAQQQIDSLKGRNRKLARKIAEDSILRHEEAVAHKEDVKKKNATIAKLKANPTIIMIRDSIPVVDSLIIAQDSLIESQSIRIIILEGDVKTLGIDLARVTDNFEAQIKAHESKLKSTQSLADAYKKDARKSRRANRWLKAGAVAIGVGGLLLGSSL